MGGIGEVVCLLPIDDVLVDDLLDDLYVVVVDVIVSVGVAVDPEPDAALVGVDLDLLVISSDDGEGCGAAGHHYDGRGDDCDDHCLLLQGFTYIGLIIQSLYNETLKCKRISFQ